MDARNFFSGRYEATSVIVTICSALSLYNAIELILLIFTTFNAYRGLYFWSLLVASCGVIPYTVGLLFEYFQLTSLAVGLAIDNVGWWTMITGQSVVLYSRLGIVLGRGHRKILKAVKWMIIIDAILFHVTTTAVNWGSKYGSQTKTFGLAYKYIEKVQMTGFCIQEFIISGLYIWKTLDVLQAGEKRGVHRVMWQLFSINVVIILLDIGLLAIEYRDLHVLEQTFKSFIYSVKLKLEFTILSKLVEFSKSTQRTLSNALADTDDFVTDARTNSGTTRVASQAASAAKSRPQWIEDVEKAAAVSADVANGHLNGPGLDHSVHQRERSVAFEEDPVKDRASVVPTEGTRTQRADPDLSYADVIRSISGAS